MGGFWNTKKVNYSEETKKVLNDLVNESKISNFYRRSISDSIKNGKSLSTNFENTSKIGRNLLSEQKKKSIKRARRPQRRTRSLIELSGAYDPVPYNPSPITINTGAAEKLRLAHLMTYGEEPTWKSLQNDQIKDGRLEYLGRRILKYPKTDGDNDDYNNKQIETNKDRFEELIDEINERSEFLTQMRKLGRLKEYQTTVETEISQLIREMEQIDLKRINQMNQNNLND
ncbi:hypothetical protein MS3_00009137 [Schistosoma haematobium]|uniref:Uncharacterized protein n=2 Tax=Schistosoma haematobium TaxID=6185 RepID=A0A922IJF2_SCHHA|nr:hypothetical protein MS3_00009137 [Schistosoma haematobium]KAH9580507.1 hypothetical protein MS3_00009137 [Schistosoma haematobium]